MPTPATTRRVIQLDAFGNPSVLRLREEQIAPPAPGKVQLRQVAIGFNYIDVYQRAGKYPLPLPTGLGHEAAGIVDSVGPGVTDFRVGERVIYMNAGIGAYADRRNVDATKLARIPDYPRITPPLSLRPPFHRPGPHDATRDGPPGSSARPSRQS